MRNGKALGKAPLARMRRRIRLPLEPAYDLRHDFPSGVAVRVRSESDWWVYNEVFVDCEYDEGIGLALGDVHCSDPRIVLDVGANVGFFTARLLDLAYRSTPPLPVDVLLVEGSPAVFADLKSRFDDGVLDDAQVRLVHGLVGNRAGSGQIAEIPFGARNTLMPDHNAGIMPVQEMVTRTVPYVDLLDVLEDGREIALLKCDVEGSEQTFLEAYAHDLLPRVRTAVFEFHHQLCDVELCRSLLTAAGLNHVATSASTPTTSLEVFHRTG